MESNKFCLHFLWTFFTSTNAILKSLIFYLSKIHIWLVLLSVILYIEDFLVLPSSPNGNLLQIRPLNTSVEIFKII